MKGDPQAGKIRLNYAFMEEFVMAYGRGFGSRDISSCLDSSNRYSGKRYSKRSHPSPFVSDQDLEYMQYYNEFDDRGCLSCPFIERVLRDLGQNASCISERLNPWLVRGTSEMCSKLIATAGNKLFAFFNGSHSDDCDDISNEMKTIVL